MPDSFVRVVTSLVFLLFGALTVRGASWAREAGLGLRWELHLVGLAVYLVSLLAVGSGNWWLAIDFVLGVFGQTVIPKIGGPKKVSGETINYQKEVELL